MELLGEPMARIEQMTRKQLDTWIHNLEQSIKADDDPHNQEIYHKWLQEARDELKARQERKQAWWECKQKGMFGG